jgi:chromosome segregation ATPase
VSSNWQLSTESQAKLKAIISFLEKDIVDLTRESDKIREIAEPLIQELPSDLKDAINALSHLDDHFAVVKRAHKNISDKAILETDKATREQQVKELYSEFKSAKQSWDTLEPELQSMRVERIKLAAQLAQLDANIQSHEAKLATLPPLDSAKTKISSLVRDTKQIKNRLQQIQNSEVEDKRALDAVNKIKTDALNVINSYLNV